ncbi:phospholipid carrier-dependent glycosyltransferase [candidate division KSB3 bacterium]|uniref:Phospholipid carrier-dependent glycosyltransferase n=1 Tax=candidate division KSB3 bacterium TaxID=2044937 RepID=A0A9D5Q4M4_9BACT|nr:phospholipid carrier-dependent glycosyltransferase [candidate division KSB3 bacterium]MBD3323071.1 phospholipid carrier-dependent glycosyltransferase [candidate division KSB3 bacterium]
MKKYVIHISILLIVCALTFWVKAGERDFWGRHGEARRAEVSREMVVSGNWVVPHLNGDPFVTKPPLYYWAAAGIFTLTGEFDELSPRIPSLIAATIGILLTYFWVSTLFSRQTGLFAGVILATSFLYGGMARTAGVDMMLTLFTTAAAYCFFWGYMARPAVASHQGTWNRSLLMYLGGTVCLGLGTLTKNPIGLAVPLLAIAGFILVTRQFKLLLEMKPWWLLLLFLIIVLPWFLVIYDRVPNFFEIVHQETLGRYTDPEGTPHYEPFYYYIPALGAFAPWVMFLPGVILSLLAKKRHQISQAHLFVIIASVTTFLLFSSVGSKREYYLLPLYPFLAILVAIYWDDYLSMKKTTTSVWTWKALEIPLVAFGGLLCLVGLSLPVAAIVYLSHYLLVSSIFGVLFLGSGLLLLVFFKRGHLLPTFGTYSAATILLYLFALMTIVPEMDVYRSRKAFFREAAALVGSHPMADYNYEGFAPQFYMQRTMPVLTEVSELESFIHQQQTPFFILMTGGHYEKLHREHPALAEKFEVVLDRTWTSAINPNRHKQLLLLKISA